MGVFPTQVGSVPGRLAILLEHPGGGSPGSVPIGTTHWWGQVLSQGHRASSSPPTELTWISRRNRSVRGQLVGRGQDCQLHLVPEGGISRVIS